VAGLAPTAPGYARFRVAPVIGGGLTSASATLETPYGLAGAAWELGTSNTATLTVTVPAGTVADVELGDVRRDLPAGIHTITAHLPTSQRPDAEPG